MNTATIELPDDPRLLQAVQDYLGELEAGRRPLRHEFLQRYPDLATPLAQCLDGLELVHHAAIKDKQPSLDATGPLHTTAAELPANPLGDFQILSEIGRGGMGVVYEAVQLSLGRRVALKVLPFAATFDAKHLQRFHKEAQAAAQLHHTNIVPVYAVGCERGTHFYAMQLIDGQSLATVIERVKVQKALGGGQETVAEIATTLSTQRSSKPREYYRSAAQFMVQAAEALEHAHQFGIVHRDIKPANLLVDVHGRLWITDFGLAQFHADASLTQTGDILGTLRYMSPEQASGQAYQLDYRTDIYSLGATLYELVTLHHIVPGDTRNEVLHKLVHEEPRAPRSLTKGVPVELETIILKAVRKHPADRYASAQDFSADLQRFLDDQPILAKRPTLVEHVRKWSRRHPAVVASGFLLLLVGIIGLLVNNWMIAKEQAKTAAALKNEQQRAAEARRALDLLVTVSEEELADQPFLQATRRRLLETALTYYQDFIETHGNDADARAELLAGKNRVRNILDELATLQGANLLGLAMDPNVQNDLPVAAAQRDQLAELNETVAEQRLLHFHEQRSLAPDVRRQKFYELAKSQEAALSDILRSEQIKRLRQIELQVQGPRAFHDSYAVEALKLTVEQKQKVRDIREETMALFRPGPPDKGGPREFGKSKPFEKSMKAEVERIVALLTPEQKARWQAMTGAPFEGLRRQPPFGSMGPPAGFGPPGGFGPQGPPFGPRKDFPR